MNNERGGTFGDRGKAGIRTYVGRAGVLVIVASLLFASILPLKFGTSREPTAPVQEKTPSPSVVGLCEETTMCPDYTHELGQLSQELRASRLEVQRLKQVITELEKEVSAVQIPTCNCNYDLNVNVSMILDKQTSLRNLAEELKLTLANEQDRILSVVQEKLEIQQNAISETHSMNAATATELQSVSTLLEMSAERTEALHTIAQMSSDLTVALNDVDSKINQLHEVVPQFEQLRAAADALVCPDPVVPAIVVPEIRVDCPTVVSSPSEMKAPATTDKDASATQPVRECIDLAQAQGIVTNMVFTEIDVLSQNLSQHCDNVLEATMGALLNAAEDAVRRGVEGHQEETERLLEEHRAFITESNAQAVAEVRQMRESKKQNSTTSSVFSVTTPEELDFALLSAGARVVTSRTSRTYYPAEWTLPAQVRSSLSTVLPEAMATASGEAVGAALTAVGAGSGEDVYRSLNLHKSLGVPEDALRTEGKLGNCWPMEGKSGNLTIMMANAVFVSSVSIEHPGRQGSGNPKSAPRTFEVYGISLDNGYERLLVRGMYNNSVGAAFRQTFPALEATHKRSEQPFQMISLRVLSNHGQPEYTCLHRFRVHGAPVP